MHDKNHVEMPKVKNSNSSVTTEIFKHPLKRNLDTSPSSESVCAILKRYKKLKDASVYQPKLQILKAKPPPFQQFCNWFKQLIDCVPIINKDAETFISDLMKIPWQFGDERIVSLFQEFILNLVTSHNYFSVHILESLFMDLLPVIDEKDEESLKIHPYEVTEELKVAHRNIIHLIVEISKRVPMCEIHLIGIARSMAPYFKKHIHIHSIYSFNMLQLCECLPNIRKELLEILIANIIKLDLHTPKVDLEEEEEVCAEEENQFEMEMPERGRTCECPESGYTLDMIMGLMFRYIHYVVHGGRQTADLYCLLRPDEDFIVNTCKAGIPSTNPGAEEGATNGCLCNKTKHDEAAAKELYLDLKQTFGKLVLPTYSCSYVQYLYFYLLAMRPFALTDFLDQLRNVFESCSASREERRNAASYLGSLLSRGNFVSFNHIHSCLQLLRNWCSSYLGSYGNSYEDLQKHAPFYFACQTIFYVFTFNYKKYTSSKTRLKQAESLLLNELALSSLNPLRYCLPAVAENFSLVARRYQMAYCQTILENNRRVTLPVAAEDAFGAVCSHSGSLDMSFPFDPYLLKRSECFVKRFYNEFEGLPDEDDEEEERNDEDAEDERPNFCLSSQSLNFSFEMSPGFKS